MAIRKRIAASREENQHKSKFKIVGKMKTKSAMNILDKSDVVYFDEPYVTDHIPGLEYVYLVIGPEWDHIGCKICFPSAGEFVDNRKAPGA